ncbi:WD repeat-containing protein 6-like [Lytechinus variegatus]|uniref:WD repeat-containing protein 6-like n=1 Tax=Lytechinus variegatus TaxID=7654 RepID=UPI001BB1B7F1|nr:WD repeat-containing protein 6-like [Lytechinus variegatus]
MPCIAIGLPVTALDVTENFILAGEGPFLHVFDLSAEQASRFSTQVLHHQVIHGIRKGHGSTFAVFGQKAINFVKIDQQNKCIFLLNNAHEVTDWIWDVCWLQSNTVTSDTNNYANEGKEKEHSLDAILPNTMVAIATGHNAVLLWDVAKMCVLTSVHCQENCILYSAKFIGQTWNDLVLAAGTVFNQVVFWRPRGSRDVSGRVVVDYRFKGHQGVIFNITYNAKLGLLATVSDDRSIRLWRHQHPPRPSGDRPTEPEHILYGHSARVWCAEILSDRIVSIGEDATCCIWNMNGEIVQKLKSHKGKSIWSLAVQRDGSFVVTGGGDSSIRRWSLKKKQHQSPADTAPSIWDVQREFKALLKGQEEVMGIDADVVPRTLTIASNGQLLVMTQGGYLFGWSNISSTYHLVMHDGNYRSYSVMASPPSSPMVAIGNINGYLKLISLGEDGFVISETEVKAHDGNVVNVTWASNEDLFSSGLNGMLTWWKVTESPSLALHAHAHFTLPPCKQRWATSVTLYGEDRFICGDRRGSVHLYQCSHMQNDRPGPVSSIPGIHGKAGTSFVCQYDGSVYSAGRDGTYRQYCITEQGEIRLENTHKVYKGFEWLEKLVFTEDGDLLVLGFHSVNFVVWSTLNNEELLTIPCGGGHRSWDLSPLDDGSMTFVCIKMKQLLVQHVPSLAWQRQTILKDDLHGREITCIKVLRTMRIAGKEHHVCVTGSEDTKVNIVSFSSPESCANSSSNSIALWDIKVLHHLHAHVSSVRALAVCHSKATGDEMLVFSVGGRYSINCWKVSFCSEASNVSSIKQICSVRHLASHSSLISTRSRQKLRQQGKVLDPDTRFLGVSVWRRGNGEGVAPTGGGLVMMCVASSDALLRFFCFDEDQCKIIPLGSSSTHDCCLLCVTSISLTSDLEVKSRNMVLTGGTDGRIVVLDPQGVEAQARKCDDDNKEGEEEEGRAGDAARYLDTVQTSLDDAIRTRQQLEIDESSKAELSGKMLEKDDTDTLLKKYSRNIPSNSLDSEAVPSATGSPRAYQHAIDHISATHQGGRSGEEGGKSLLHQETPSSKSLSAVRTSGSPSFQGHSSPSSSLPFDRDENIQSISMATYKSTESVASPVQLTNNDVGDKGKLQNAEAMSMSPRQAAAVTFDEVEGHDTGSGGQLVSSWSAHQSGINALSVCNVQDDKWLVVSGGDDNAITVTLVDFTSSVTTENERTIGTILDTYKIPTAHATQVTGIQFTKEANTFLSVSVDQRLNLWRLKLSEDNRKIEEVRMMSSSFVHVSDVAGMDTWCDRSSSQQYAVICGQGLQLQSISTKEDDAIR